MVEDSCLNRLANLIISELYIHVFTGIANYILGGERDE